MTPRVRWRTAWNRPRERGRRQREATAEQVEAVVGQVVDQVVAVLDIDGIVSQVDIDDIVKEVDIDDIVKRVDIDDIITRVDIDGIVQRTEVGTLIVQSTGGIVTQFLDFVRSLGVTFDDVSDRIVDRVLRRGRRRPVAPVLLGGSVADVVDATPSTSRTEERGRHEGRPSRHLPRRQLRRTRHPPGRLRDRRLRRRSRPTASPSAWSPSSGSW